MKSDEIWSRESPDREEGRGGEGKRGREEGSGTERSHTQTQKRKYEEEGERSGHTGLE